MHLGTSPRRARQFRIHRLIAASAAALGFTGAARAGLLNPNAFNSLGTLNVNSGSITINTDALAITGAATFNGTSFSQGGGAPQIAVFTFGSLNLGAGVTVSVTGSRALALLSRNSMNIASGITLTGGNGGFPTAGTAAPAGGFAGGTAASGGADGGNGAGAGGGQGGSDTGGGGAYGGAGGDASSGGVGGASYGNLLLSLQGGSGGGGGAHFFGGAGGGGGGGGAIELGAVGTLTLSSVIANGGDGGDTFLSPGGSGAGGGLLLHADQYSISTVQAIGGNGHGAGGPGGGGGRITLAGGTLTAAQIAPLLASVNGGVGHFGGGNGIAGVLTFQPVLAVVQSTQSLDVGITPGQTGQGDARIETLPGALTVQSGGTANLVSPIVWGLGSVVSLTGGVLNVANDTTFSSGSTLSWGNASMSFVAGKALTINGGVGTIAGAIGLSNGTTLRITGGGSVNVNNYLDVGNSTTGGATGTMVVDGAGSRFTADVTYTDWGRNTGDSATVTLDHGGVATYAAGLAIAGNGGTVLANLLNGAQLNTASLSVGSPGAAATLNIIGGVLNSTGPAALFSGAQVNLSAGSFVLGDDGTIGTGATLNWAGGTLNLAVGRTLSIDGGTLIHTHDGHAVNGNALSIINGGKYLTSTWLDIGNIGGSAGTLLVSDPNSAFQASSVCYWGDGSTGTAYARFSGGGVGTLLGGLEVGRNGAAASVDIQPGSTLTTASLALGSSANLGGTISAVMNIAGTVRVLNGAQFQSRAVALYSGGTFEIGGTLAISGSAVVVALPGGDKTIRVGNVSISDTSKLNLTDNDMIIDHTSASQLAAVKSYIAGGYNGGDWLGSGIRTSSGDALVHGLGYGENSLLGFTTFAGLSVGPTALLVKYTYFGDGNLDGMVDIKDLYLLASHFKASDTVWTGGDFNYDGVTNAVDLGMLAHNWQSGVGSPLGASLDSALTSVGLPLVSVPEPVLAPLGLATALLVRRRARR